MLQDQLLHPKIMITDSCGLVGYCLATLPEAIGLVISSTNNDNWNPTGF